MARRPPCLPPTLSVHFILATIGLFLGLNSAAAQPFEDADCLLCHGEATEWNLEDPQSARLFVHSASFEGSIHDGMACVDCHEGIAELPHAEKMPKVNCGSCHEDSIEAYQHSVHGKPLGASGEGETASCVSCHGSHRILPASDPASPVHHANLAKTCIQCHEDQALIESHHLPSKDNIQTYVISVHGQSNVHDSESKAASCNDCHGWHDIRPASEPESSVSRSNVVKTCGQCHEDVMEEFYSSVHGSLGKEGNPDVPVCTDCHGEHQIKSPDDRSSTVSRLHIAETCGKCHEDESIVEKYDIPISHPSALYQNSVHGKALLSGANEKAAACQDCHGHHSILPGDDPASKVNRLHISETCGSCHQEDGIQEEYENSVHGKAVKKGVREAPVCTDCHGEHTILSHLDPESPVYSTKLAKEVCARCHDSVVVTRKYGMSTHNVETFLESYHGLAGRLGDTTVANCASCHGVHNILQHDDPKSLVHKDNLVHTCGSCHPGANEQFVAGMVHVDLGSNGDTRTTHNFYMGLVRIVYMWLIALSIGGMLLHNFIIIFRHVRDKYRLQKNIPHVQRFPRVALVQHMLLTISFSVLVLTGFSLSFPDSLFSDLMKTYLALGEVQRSWAHRGAGVVLALTTVWHLLTVFCTQKGRSELKALWPRLRDLGDLWQNLIYHMGLSNVKPKFDRYDYSEKLEYWAFLWGAVIMVLTGLLMWFPAQIAIHLGISRFWVEIGALVHYYEAWLATLAIIIWHFFFVIFHPEEYPMDVSWLTGKLSVHAMEERHPEELDRLREEGKIVGLAELGPIKQEGEESNLEP